MVVHTFNPTQHSEGRGTWISVSSDQPSLQNEFQESQGYYTEKPCIEKSLKKKKKKVEAEEPGIEG